MREAARGNDAATLYRRAHALKGAAGTIGANALLARAEALARVAQGEPVGADADAAALLAKALADDLENLLHALSAALADHAGGTPQLATAD